MKFGSRPLENLVHRFWEIEKYKVSPPTFTVEESLCEEHFVKNVSVNNKGRIQVRLPFKGSTAGLGQSYEIAQARSSLLEKRLERDPLLRKAYVEFMNEYISQGHMSPIGNVDRSMPHFHIPHHCVIKPQNLTTKLRVVLNASAKTTSGTSLNDILLVGPTIQQDLVTTVLPFRLNSNALTCIGNL